MQRTLPSSFVIELTKRCNNHCLYCYMPDRKGENADPERQEEMSTAEVAEIIAKLREQTNVTTIALSGGETLLRDDLPEILACIRSYGIAPVIITNGTLLTEKKVASLGAGVTYEITLLSYQQEVHDRMAGRRGAWDAVISGMVNVRRAGGRFITVFVATKLNFEHLRKTAELGIALGADGLMYNRMNAGRHNLRQADRLLPTPEMIRGNLDALEDVCVTYHLPVSISVVIEPCVIDVRAYKHLRFGWCPLAAEGSYFTIDPLGNIRVCNHSPTILGNLKRDRFDDIYNGHPFLQAFRETYPAECVDCVPDLKSMCRGGCKAAGEQCCGSIERVDPFVTLNRRVPPAPATIRQAQGDREGDAVEA